MIGPPDAIEYAGSGTGDSGTGTDDNGAGIGTTDAWPNNAGANSDRNARPSAPMEMLAVNINAIPHTIILFIEKTPHVNPESHCLGSDPQSYLMTRTDGVEVESNAQGLR